MVTGAQDAFLRLKACSETFHSVAGKLLFVKPVWLCSWGEAGDMGRYTGGGRAYFVGKGVFSWYHLVQLD